MSNSIEISPNFVGNEEDLKKEEIFKDFDINYVPLNNLPVNYFPLNNPVLSKELKTIDMTSVSNPIKTTDFTAPEYNTASNLIKIITNNIQFEVKQSFNCEFLLVGGGGGGGKHITGGGGGGGGQLIYFQDYKLSKGTYTVQIGSGGTGATSNNGSNGNESKLIKDNKDLFVAKGGKGAQEINGGIGGEYINNKGLGGNGGISKTNGLGGQILTIEGSPIKYGYGGDGNTPETNRNNNNGNGGNGGLSNGVGFNGNTGVFIIKLKNSTDINNIKKIELGSSLNIINSSSSTGIIQEIDVNDNTKKLLKYTTVGSNNSLFLNTDLYCDILLVGGGGAGGWYGGGGGGGGVFEVFNYKLNAGTYTINVGAGGNENAGGITYISSNSVRLLGAGGGGLGKGHGISGTAGVRIEFNDGVNSGGGGGSAYYTIEGTSGNGYSGNGGRALQNQRYVSGGGGGANENGEDGTINKSGKGGDGKFSEITKLYYGGGGGGAYYNGVAGEGGEGGGGKGGTRNSGDLDYTGEDGKINTGGGGGGVTRLGGGVNGGSGIVIIRVPKEALENSGNKDILMDLVNRDTKVLNKIKEEFKKKLKDLDNNQKPFNYFNIFPLVILIIIIWIFIILFLLKLLHHFFANIYIYILLTIIIFILLFGSLWFLYTNNDLL